VPDGLNYHLAGFLNHLLRYFARAGLHSSRPAGPIRQRHARAS
jgi:hypothetical protein